LEQSQEQQRLTITFRLTRLQHRPETLTYHLAEFLMEVTEL
jgi:hypothetical protein